MIYNTEHRELMATVRAFCEKEINPFVGEWEKRGLFPAHELFAKMARLGLLGITKPRSVGGLGLDYSYQLAFCEALGASRCASINLAVGVQTDMATPALAKYGSEALQEEFLRPTIAGDFVAAVGLSEVGAGSDLAAITTVAKRDGGDYVLTGGKMWTTNALQADWVCVLCNTSDGATVLNKSLICVPKHLPGVSVGPPLQKLGMHASDTAQLFFDEVRVPQRYRIGREGRGLIYQMEAFIEERLWISACGLLAMERLLAETTNYARERKVFGRAVLDNQVVQFRLAELATSVELLRSLVYRATEQYVGGVDVTRLVAMAKLTAGRLQRELTNACLQYYGGLGFMESMDVARAYRDSRLASIGGGADEVMLMMISRLSGMSLAREATGGGAFEGGLPDSLQ